MSALSPTSRNALSSPAVARFAPFQRLAVRQKKRWAEILLSFEFKNKYEVVDENQALQLRVEEQGQGVLSVLARIFLGPLRPFVAHVVDAGSGEGVLSLRRPFRFFFHRLEVSTASGEALGSIDKEWSWVRRIYSIRDPSGNHLATIYGPFLKPWTFELLQNERKIGAIVKRFSGLGKELFTDADNFGVDLAEVGDARLKALAFAATVLIDVVHFERAK